MPRYQPEPGGKLSSLVKGRPVADDGDTLAVTFAVKVAAKVRPKYENLVCSFPERIALVDAVTAFRPDP